MIDPRISLVGIVKHLRIEHVIIGRELCRSGIRQRIECREVLHDGVKPVARNLVIRKRRPYVTGAGGCGLSGSRIVDCAQTAEIAVLHGGSGHGEYLGQPLVNTGTLIVAKNEGLVSSLVDPGQIHRPSQARTQTDFVEMALWDGRN